MINWKLRLKNKTTLVSLLTLCVTFVYTLLSTFDVVPKISQNDIMNLLLMLVQLLVGVGVVVDPTTKGISDSNRALTYNSPHSDSLLDD